MFSMKIKQKNIHKNNSYLTGAFFLTLLFLAVPHFVLADLASEKLLQYSETDPSHSDFTYLGAFKVPVGNYALDLDDTEWFNRGGFALTFRNFDGGRLLMARNRANPDHAAVGEIDIPTPSLDINNLPRANLTQSLTDISNGHLRVYQPPLAGHTGEDPCAQPNHTEADIGTGGSVICGQDFYYGGLLTDKTNLYGSVYGFYDAGSEVQLTHFKTSIDLSNADPNFSGFVKVGSTPDVPQSGYVGGYMTWIPPEWQTALGGYPALTGQGGLSVANRTGYGPTIFGFDPSRIGQDNPVTAFPLIRYDSDNSTYPNHWLASGNGPPNVFFNGTSQINGVVFPVGSRSVIFFGKHGIAGGVNGGVTGGVSGARPENSNLMCYGAGTADVTQEKSNLNVIAWTKANILSSGTNTAVASEKLIDSNANFSAITAPLTLQVRNLSNNQVVTVVAVDNNNQLSIGYNIFTSPGTSYRIEEKYPCGVGGDTAYLGVDSNDACCYDPDDFNKGGHAYPYSYYAWAYDALDLLAAKQGNYQVTQNDYNTVRFTDGSGSTPPRALGVGQIVHPWNLKPYAVWPIDFPTPRSTHWQDTTIAGAAYDPDTQRLYLAQVGADGNLPLIHVYQLNLPLATGDTTAPSAPSGLSVQ